VKQQKLIWSKTLLDNGSYKTQNEWKSWCKRNGYRLPTQAEYVGEVRRLLKAKDSEYKTLFLNDLRKYYLMTSETLPCLDGVERALVLGVVGGDVGFVGIDGGRPARGVRDNKKKKKVQS